AQKMIKPPSKRMGTSESRVWKMQHATKQKNMHQNIKALETRVQKLEHVEKPKEFPTIKMNFSYLKQLQGRYVIRVNNLSVNFDNRLLWKEASFAIKGGEKVAIIGDNGVGKTTLLKKILNRVPEVTISPSVKIGYFSQNLDALKLQNSILENVISSSIQDETTVRTVLARLHFYNDDVYKEIKVLSGGERVKVTFAKLFVSDCNTLILDEPTNYLDIDAVKALEELLMIYKGVVIFVSHDNRFVGNIATRIIEIENEEMTIFDGSFDEYKSSKAKNEKNPQQGKRLLLDTKISEILSRLSVEPSEELESEFQELLKEKRKLEE